MVIIFDNPEKYFSPEKLVKITPKVGGGVINIPVSSDDVLDVPVSSDDVSKKSKIYTRDLFEQVKKNMNTGNNRKIGDGFMRIDRL